MRNLQEFILNLSVSIAKQVDYIHDDKVGHLNITERNILVSIDGLRVRLVNFDFEEQLIPNRNTRFYLAKVMTWAQSRRWRLKKYML